MKISIIGRGNVATHLYHAFKNKADVDIINPHTLKGMPADSDVILISVADSAIEEVIEQMSSSEAVVAHTAGSVPIDIVSAKFKNAGVFYPLQTFTKGVELDYSKIPVFIEGSSIETVNKLKSVASMFSNHIYNADSAMRKQLHLASVFACNFSNAMFSVAHQLLQEANLDFKVVLPLLQQTFQKLNTVSPGKAQTGPAIRDDQNVMSQHLEMLSQHPELAQLYKSISKLIKEYASSEL